MLLRYKQFALSLRFRSAIPLVQVFVKKLVVKRLSGLVGDQVLQ